MLLSAGVASALDPSRALSQYVRERWGPDRGFPRGAVYAIAQTADGYLWIGTEAGLIRFDGLNFKLIAAETPMTTVLGLVADNENNLWIRLPGPALLRYRDGVFEDAMGKLGMPYSNITVMSKSNQRGLVVARLEEGVVVHDKGKFSLNLAATPLARSPVISILQAPAGDIWMGTRDAGLFRLSGGRVTAVSEGLPDTKINCLLSDGERTLWVGTDRGVVQWDGTKLSTAGIPKVLNQFQALSMARDRDGNIWVGTNSKGLLRFNTQGIAELDDGQSKDEAVTAIFEDREGNLWTGRADGIERLSDSAFTTFGLTEGLPADGSIPIFVDAKDRLWFAPAVGGLWWVHGGQRGEIKLDGLDRDVIYSITGQGNDLWLGRQRGGLTRLRYRNGGYVAMTYTRRDGLAQDSVYSVHASRDGSMWAGTLSGGVSQLQGGKFTTYAAGGLASNTVPSMLETRDGSMWFATPNGLSSFSGGQWRTYGLAEGLPSINVNCLYEDSEGMLWVGTAAGLAFGNSTGFHALANTPAALRESVFGIEEDQYEWLWLATSGHVLRVNRAKLMRGFPSESDVREYGLADGLRGMEGVKRHRSVMSDTRGQIWFSLNQGISAVDPARLVNGAAPVLAQVQTIFADGEPLDWRGSAQIAGGPRRIILGFAGLGLSAPERVRFRYMLEGFDGGWSQPSTAREAVYTNLDPATYRFHVLASGPDESWNGSEASIVLTVEPLFWQTWLFRVAAILTVVLAIVGIYRFRLRQMTGELKLRFEERLAERNRIAQELHDTLLQGFLSASMQLHVTTDSLPEESPAKPPLNRILALMSQVIDEGRNAVRGLRSTATEDLCDAFSRIPLELGRVEPGFKVIVEGQPRSLNPVMRDEIYRIGREALVNAFRHARAKSIEMELEYRPRNFRFLVRDDGCGIDDSVLRSGREGHWGLPGMRERAERIGGQLHVWSRAAAGTEVVLSVPGHIAFAEPVSKQRFSWLRFRRRITRGNQ